jgi:diguanylate cyclase (GGDEF)-like protein
MNDENREISEILKICLLLELEVFNLYKKFEESSSTPELRNFWNNVAEGKRKRVLFWEKALSLTEADILPDFFEDLEDIQDKLEKLRLNINELTVNIGDLSNNYEILAIAYKLEFLMMDPPLSTMFQLLGTINGVKSADCKYENPMTAFVNELLKHGEKIPQSVEFMEETIHSLLRDNKRLASESNIDILTGVHNRKGFFNAINPILHLAFRKKINVAIIIADIDDFKDVNFTYGHLGGDEALKNVASVIHSTMRKSDIIGRYGGGEFIIYADCMDLAGGNVLAERIRKNVETETKVSLGFKLTLSLGVASGQIGQTVENDIMVLMKKADDNLLKAKSSGKNKVVC